MSARLGARSHATTTAMRGRALVGNAATRPSSESSNHAMTPVSRCKRGPMSVVQPERRLGSSADSPHSTPPRAITLRHAARVARCEVSVCALFCKVSVSPATRSAREPEELAGLPSPEPAPSTTSRGSSWRILTFRTRAADWAIIPYRRFRDGSATVTGPGGVSAEASLDDPSWQRNGASGNADLRRLR